MKKYKRKSTIDKELRWTVLSLMIVLILCYTVLLEDYLFRGIDIASKIEFEIFARDYEQRKINDPNTPLPSQPYMHSFKDWSNVPIEFKTLFPESEHSNNELFKISIYEGNNNRETDYLFMRYLLVNNDYLYMVAKYPPDMLNNKQVNEYEEIIFITFPLALAFIVMAVMLIYLLSRRIARSSNALNDWAEQLSLTSMNEDRPDFRYAELNGIAECLQQAFQRIAGLLEKEHLFLQFTSHELRTPLAITLANVELLEKLGLEPMTEKSMARIKRANKGMLQITEALLWLSRESDSPPVTELVNIDNVMDDIINEYRYLLKDKKVDVKFKKRAVKLDVPVIILKIILSNLVRNAFQYTSEGNVIIDIVENKIMLRNQNNKDFDELDNEHGFGLGLVLVQRLTVKLGWVFSHQTIAGGRVVNIMIK